MSRPHRYELRAHGPMRCRQGPFEEKMVKLGNVYYTVRLEERGAVGVTKWTHKPTWPVLADVSTLFVTLADGVCVPMPDAPWAADAVARWHAVRKSLQATHKSTKPASRSVGIPAPAY